MRRGAEARAAWKARLEAAPAAVRAAFVKAIAGEIGAEVEAAIAAHKAKLFASKPTMATRKASEAALEALTEAVPELVGGSADLTHSNNTITKATKPIRPGEFGGRYVHYGVREHAMAAIMNGIALHEGLVPYGGTFLVFSDYCRNSIRLSALMGLRVVYVMTHDSIGLGEDGPTHQPVEHLPSLRAIPNLLVFRPADAVETAECWELALSQRKTPSILALTRQNVPPVRTEPSEGNLCAKGGYVLAEATGGARALTILATGSEVHLALEARARLEARGVPTAVVSLPCFELFDAQPPAYRAAVLGEAPRIAIEAASPFGWARYVGSEEDVVAVRGFGASAPAADLFRAYGITTDALVSLAERKLGLAPAT
jgi:transketolase